MHDLPRSDNAWDWVMEDLIDPIKYVKETHWIIIIIIINDTNNFIINY